MGTERTHDTIIRAAHFRRHDTARSILSVAAVLFLVALVTIVAPSLARSAASSDADIASLPPKTTTALPAPTAQDVALETVSRGEEGLELSARLTEDGGIIQRPVGWTVTSADGGQVFSDTASIAQARLAPGDYLIRIDYDAVHLSQSVSLPPGTRMIVSFVLDAGGIRVLPRVKQIGMPATASVSLIYALDGVRRGELIATSNIPGEIIRVPAGEYRIESHFAAGNASAVADVHVNAGRMSAVEIDHQAGLARLAFVGAPATAVKWQVEDSHGAMLPAVSGLSADMVLKPGTYVATAHAGGEVLTAKFVIEPGEARDIILGN
ncbi:hypothetical protein [Aestuariivirga sp.]|uniref:hypothetical protein n=1 Tax=Aestuariivirga sp. TaxID=2650926 RepID=UPI0039E438BE